VFNIRSGLLAIALIAVARQAPAQYVRGVNVSQAEWGDPLTGVYGVDYSYPAPPTFDYFAARGLSFVRLQVQWERLQPTLGGPLDPTNLGYVQQVVAAAKAAGGLVSIVPHNQARYSILLNGVETLCIIDNPCAGSTVTVTAADLADFWVKMSNEFKDEPAVAAYDIMNEPHDMGVASWAQIAQTVVSAVRANSDNKLLMIPGDGWSSAPDWLIYNGLTSFVSDPAANYYYEAHEYFDSDGSGTYAETYDQELAANSQLADVGVARLSLFVQWCTVNNVRCYLGEYGIPNTDPRWLTVLDNFLHSLDEAGLPGTYWAAGELWARVNYPLSVQPLGDFAIDREQLPTLLAHLPPASFVTISAAASFGYAVAPGSLVAGYGAGLATGTEQAALPLPTKLQDTQVEVTDSSGNVAFAPLLYVSPGQLNYRIPAGTAAGLATAMVLSGGTKVASGVLEVSSIAPTLFMANGTGQGVAAAQIQRVKPDGTSTFEDVAVYDQGSGQFVASPISFEGDQLFLLLYGTGFDQASGASGTTVTIGETATQVAYSGPQSQFAGLDQINAALPVSLAGAGQVTVSVTVDGTAANAVTITFQ